MAHIADNSTNIAAANYGALIGAVADGAVADAAAAVDPFHPYDATCARVGSTDNDIATHMAVPDGAAVGGADDAPSIIAICDVAGSAEGQVFNDAIFCISEKPAGLTGAVVDHIADGVSVAVKTAHERLSGVRIKAICTDRLKTDAAEVEVGIETEVFPEISVAVVYIVGQFEPMTGGSDDVGIFSRSAAAAKLRPCSKRRKQCEKPGQEECLGPFHVEGL